MSKNTNIDFYWEKECLHLFLAEYGAILFIVADNEDMHKSLNEFEFRPDFITDYGVSCNRVDHLEFRRHHFFSVAYDQIHFRFVGNTRSRLNSNFTQGQNTNYGVDCP